MFKGDVVEGVVVDDDVDVVDDLKREIERWDSEI